MMSEWTNPAGCNCLALRQAARHVSQFYDQFLTPNGLRTTQYSLLARLQRKDAMTINALAADLVTDRTTLARNLLPLEREGLIAIEPGQADRRSKDVRLTSAGAARLRSARNGWEEAQAQFEKTFGVKRAKELRKLLHEIATEQKIASAEASAVE
jgi:DNA-binding MarR family transcriptional regulator